jgi:hypothetical protein
VIEPKRSVPCGRCASIEPSEYAGSTTALRDRIFAATHRLADLEAFELRMVEVDHKGVASTKRPKPYWNACSPCRIRQEKPAFFESIFATLFSLTMADTNATVPIGASSCEPRMRQAPLEQ